MTHSERCQAECTRDVVFLLRYKRSKKSTRFAEVEGVWLSRQEAEAFARSHEYRWPGGWQVYGLPANGKLAELIKVES